LDHTSAELGRHFVDFWADVIRDVHAHDDHVVVAPVSQLPFGPYGGTMPARKVIRYRCEGMAKPLDELLVPDPAESAPVDAGLPHVRELEDVGAQFLAELAGVRAVVQGWLGALP